MEDENGNLVESVANIFDENDYIINIGPQHPSTHGVMHFRTALDGEIVKKIDVNSGYIHRGIEKLCESMTYPQSLHLTDRLDYLSAGINRHDFVCVLKSGWNSSSSRRIHPRDHGRAKPYQLAPAGLAAHCNDLGATTVFIYGVRERGDVLDILTILARTIDCQSERGGQRDV